MPTALRPILLVEDSSNDVELTLDALQKSGLVNPVVVARDGVEALDHRCRGNAGPGRGVNAFVVKPVGHREFFDAIRDLGVFWAVLNERPPPGVRMERGGAA